MSSLYIVSKSFCKAMSNRFPAYFSSEKCTLRKQEHQARCNYTQSVLLKSKKTSNDQDVDIEPKVRNTSCNMMQYGEILLGRHIRELIISCSAYK